MEGTDIKDKNLTIKVGTAIAVLIVIVNFAMWVGIKTNSAERDILDLNKVTIALNEKLKEQNTRMERLENAQNSEAVIFKELTMTIDDLKKTVENLTRKIDGNYKH